MEVVLVVYSAKTKHVFISHQQNARQIHNIECDKFRIFRITLTNQISCTKKLRELICHRIIQLTFLLQKQYVLKVRYIYQTRGLL
jgi:hypothetical protein